MGWQTVASKPETSRVQRSLRIALVASTLLPCASLLSGCAGFFDVPKAGTPGGPPVGGGPGTTPSTFGDYVYVVNFTAATLTGFLVGGTTLTGLAGAPYALPANILPSSVIVTRQNTFVYVGGTPGIACYLIGAGGALSLQTGGGASALANFVSLDVSPDGQWLFGLDTLTQIVYVYAINPSSGLLTLASQTPYAAPPNSGTISPRAVRISPNGGLVAVALGFGGDVLFTFNTATGVLTAATLLTEPAGFSDNAVTFDGQSAFAYFARVGTAGVSGVAAYGVTTAGGLTGGQALAPSGGAPSAVVLDSTGTYLYAANRGDGTITAYTVANGVLTMLPGGPFSNGGSLTALALDNTGKHVVAVASGGPADVTSYSFDPQTPGKLLSVATAASGPPPAGSVAIAATH